MANFRGMTILLLGIGYLLRAESSADHRDLALPHYADGNVTKLAKAEKSQRGRRTYFSKDLAQTVTVIVGQSAILLCRVYNLGNRTVSWIRQRDLHILTSMSLSYTNDARFRIIDSPKGDVWNLRIDYVEPRDAGIYECQVNAEPKISRAVTLKVLDIHAKITGPQELYVKKGSTISLTCIVNSQDLPPSNVTWYHAGIAIDFDGPSSFTCNLCGQTSYNSWDSGEQINLADLLKTLKQSAVQFDRGGVSLETEKGKDGTTSKLLITRATHQDSGNYTCVSSQVAPANVMVYVLNGEHPAAMQHGGTGNINVTVILLASILLLDTVLR